MRKTRILLLSLILTLIVFSQCTFAETASVVHDSGNNDQFGTLPINYVHLKLDMKDAVIESGSGWGLGHGYSGSSGSVYTRLLYYTGKFTFGSRSTSNSEVWSPHKNTLPDVTVRFPGGAALSDGTSCDVLITFSEIAVRLGKARADGIGDNTILKHAIANGNGNLGFITYPPRKNFSEQATADQGINSGASVTNSFKVTMKVVNAGTTTAVSQPSMLVEFKDIDARDIVSVTGNSYAPAEWAGEYAESVEMLDGWISGNVDGYSGKAVLAPVTNDLANTCLVTSDTHNGNTRIKPDASKIAAFINTFNPPAGDYGSLYSGFIAAVKPSGFSFYWSGASRSGMNAYGCMGTRFGGQPTVSVSAMREGAGASESSLRGAAGTKSGVNYWENNTHLMNSAASYTATPASGCFLKYLKVDDTDQPLSNSEKYSGKTYIFTRLNKYPINNRDIRNGAVYDTGTSGIYYIRAAFGHLPKYEVMKIVDKEGIRIGSTEKLHYQVMCDEIYEDASADTFTFHDDLANGLLNIDTSSIRVTASGGTGSYTYDPDAPGISVTFSSSDADGSKPHLALSYTATVNWDRYNESQADSIINTAKGRNRPEVGGNETGNSTEVRVLSDIKVTKAVAGDLRDETKKFEFEVSLTGIGKNKSYVLESIGGGELAGVISGTSTGNGFKATDTGEAVLKCKASGKQGFTIRNIPVGCTYRILEKASDHKPSYKLSSDSENAEFEMAQNSCNLNWMELATECEVLDKTDGVVTAAFTNTKNSTTVTGIKKHYGWVMVLGIITMITIAVFAVNQHGRKVSEKEADDE